MLNVPGKRAIWVPHCSALPGVWFGSEGIAVMSNPRIRPPNARIMRHVPHATLVGKWTQPEAKLRHDVIRRRVPIGLRQVAPQFRESDPVRWRRPSLPSEEKSHGAQSRLRSFRKARKGVGEAYFADAYLPEMDCAIEPEVIPDAYPDFARRYTGEGGVEFTYKDHDISAPVLLVRSFLWLGAMGGTASYSWAASPYPMKLATTGVLTFNIIGLLVMAIIYGLILAKPVEIYRTLEVRPDRLIVDRTEEFYRDNFECGWPVFQPDGQGEAAGTKLIGNYGTRYIEFLTVVRFDEFDRMPEVFAVNLSAAFEQLWVQPGSRCLGPSQTPGDQRRGDGKR